jgi:hypothetical protein
MNLVAIGAALLISVLNSAAAIIIIKRAFRAAPEKFNKIVFMSLVIRYFCVAGLIGVALLVFELDKFALSLTFMLSTFILLMFEILYINSKAKLLNLQNNNNV